MLSCPLCQYSCWKSMYLVNIWIQKRWVNQGSKCSRKLKWVAVSPCSFPSHCCSSSCNSPGHRASTLFMLTQRYNLLECICFRVFLEGWNKLPRISLTISFSNMSFSLQCFFFAKKLDTSLCFDKKGFPAAFQNATPVHIFVAISVQALSLITNLKFWAYIFKTHVLPGSD